MLGLIACFTRPQVDQFFFSVGQEIRAKTGTIMNKVSSLKVSSILICLLLKSFNHAAVFSFPLAKIEKPFGVKEKRQIRRTFIS